VILFIGLSYLMKTLGEKEKKNDDDDSFYSGLFM
jgi:hypothetical protein